MEDDQLPQNIKGVVIISLPPPDKPFMGKTITAFTVTDHDNDDNDHSVIPNEERSHLDDPESDDVPIQSYPHDHQLGFSLRRLLSRGPTKFFSFIGVILFALVLYGSVSSQTLEELRNSERKDGATSFFFPLFPKFGMLGQQDVKLKLDKVVDFQGNPNINKLVASKVADSSTVFPVLGSVYPDGYVDRLFVLFFAFVS